MNIEIGKFIRKNEHIGRIIDIIDEDYFRIDSITYMLKIEDGIKISDNVIDLIEEGDYVNGYKVTEKDSTLLVTHVHGIDGSGCFVPISQYGEDIKTIVTKEQFENAMYKLGE